MVSENCTNQGSSNLPSAMGSGASASTKGRDMSVDDIKSALTGLDDESVEKLQKAIDGLEAEDFQKLFLSFFQGLAAASEADVQYMKTTGLDDIVNGFARCALKMKPKDLNQFGTDYFSGVLGKQPRLVLISSNAGDVEKLKSCVRDRGDMGAPIVTSVYDFEANAEDLTKQIKGLCEGGPFKTVALCCHGSQEEMVEDIEGFKWQLLEGCGVQIGTGGKSDEGSDDILQALADATSIRLDLLACDLASSKVGLQWITDWEEKIGKNVAASQSVTGNAECGGNWVLETDGINVSQVYFKQDAIQEYDQVFKMKVDKGKAARILAERAVRAAPRTVCRIAAGLPL